MRVRSILAIFFVTLPLFFFGQGCFIGVDPDDPNPPGPTSSRGNIEIKWLFEGGEACPVDVKNIEKSIFDSQGDKVFSDLLVDCDQDSKKTPDLNEGSYDIRVRGLDSNDEVTWDSPVRSITVLDDKTAAVTFDLEEAP